MENLSQRLDKIIKDLNEPPTINFLSSSYPLLRDIEKIRMSLISFFEKLMGNKFFIVNLNETFYLSKIKETQLGDLKIKPKICK